MFSILFVWEGGKWGEIFSFGRRGGVRGKGEDRDQMVGW